MKCKYSNCKLGGEVDKESAIKDGNAYYHKECQEKRLFKRSVEDRLKRFLIKDVRMAMKKAIDDNNYPIDFVEFIIDRYDSKFDSPYSILYYAKNRDAIKDYMVMKSKKSMGELSKNLNSIEVEKETEFNFSHKFTPKWMKVYGE